MVLEAPKLCTLGPSFSFVNVGTWVENFEKQIYTLINYNPQYLLIIYSVTGTELGTRNIKMNKAHSSSSPEGARRHCAMGLGKSE